MLRSGEITERSGLIMVRSDEIKVRIVTLMMAHMSPGISFSARVIVFLPQSAREMSATLYGTCQERNQWEITNRTSQTFLGRNNITTSSLRCWWGFCRNLKKKNFSQPTSTNHFPHIPLLYIVFYFQLGLHFL